MYDWIWILVAGWVGFLVGFLTFALVRMASSGRSDEELAQAAREYYRT